MPRITFEKRYQIWKATADEDGGRPVLSHVLLEPDGVMVATNGYIMAVVPCEITWEPEEKKQSLLIRGNVFQFAVKASPPKSKTASINVSGDEATVQMKDHRIVSKLWTDSSFPSWRASFPDTTQIALGEQTFDAELAALLARALGTSQLTYVFTGLEKGILALPLDSDGVGCIMPIRYTKDSPPLAIAERRLLRFSGGALEPKKEHKEEVKP